MTGTGFEFKLEEWDYLDGVHAVETVSYLVIESGTHTLNSGARVTAKTLDGVDHDWKSVSFGSAFATTPVVLAQASSYNGASAVTPRLQSVTKSGFQLSLQEEEANDGWHAEETVSYVAVETVSDIAGGIYTGRTGTDVTDTGADVAFAGSFSSTPVLFAAIQTYEGADPAALRYNNLKVSGVRVLVEEERSKDDEMDHVAEQVGFLALTTDAFSGTLAAADAQAIVAAPSLVQEELSFDLSPNLPNPFSGRTLIRYSVAEAVPVQIEVYDTVGRRVAILQDGTQGAGRHEVPFDGTGLPSGVYIYQMRAGAFVKTHQMTLVR